MAAPVAVDLPHSVPAKAMCRCFGGRRIAPLRIHVTAARALAGRLTGAPSDAFLATVLMDYRCADCKQLVLVTVGEILRT
jgi:hypothetical protein